MTNESKALSMVKAMSNAQLIEAWEITEKQLTTLETFEVRGWLMDEMKRRDSYGFDKWISNEDITKDGPEHYLFN